MAEAITHTEWLGELDRLFREQDAGDESANTVSSTEAAEIWGIGLDSARRALIKSRVRVNT